MHSFSKKIKIILVLRISCSSVPESDLTVIKIRKKGCPNYYIAKMRGGGGEGAQCPTPSYTPMIVHFQELDFDVYLSWNVKRALYIVNKCRETYKHINFERG